MSARTHTHTHTHTDTHTRANTHRHTHARTHARTHTRAHTHRDRSLHQDAKLARLLHAGGGTRETSAEPQSLFAKIVNFIHAFAARRIYGFICCTQEIGRGHTGMDLRLGAAPGAPAPALPAPPYPTTHRHTRTHPNTTHALLTPQSHARTRSRALARARTHTHDSRPETWTYTHFNHEDHDTGSLLRAPTHTRAHAPPHIHLRRIRVESWRPGSCPQALALS